MAKKKYICAGCNKCTEPCTVELSGDTDMTKDPAKMLHCGTWVEVPVEEDTNKEQLPKLTADVFAMEECPDWAQYAAVDAEGIAYWYAAKPKLDPQAWCNASEHFVARQITLENIPIRYDRANWRNSLIERPVEQRLPRLTVDVFCREECPEWAEYAAVDADGDAYWYAGKPRPLGAAWYQGGGYRASQIGPRYDASDWKNSLIERPAVAPKLTQDVFSATDCPEWARYAAVDENGSAYWYEMQPQLRLGSSVWFSSGLRSQMMYLPNRFAAIIFDSTDWMHSLIERPAVVPDWFKPGALACNVYTHTCFHVTDSTEYCENYLEAKVRPFNDDELERKLGQCVLGPKNSRLLVTGFRPKGDISGKPEICVLCGWLTAEELLTYGSRPQGINQYRSTEGTWIDCGLSS